MSTTQRPRLLLVDDEPRVLEGLSLHLGRRYDVAAATSGAAALDHLGKDPTVAVVISDMRMPGMDGATLLTWVRQVVPDAVRVLLTGQSDLAATIAAINEGQIFRFLTKPCPPAALLGAVEAAVAQHRLVTGERVLLEQTLHGSIKTLIDVLSLTNPASFGRACRLKQHVADLAVKLELPERWQVEVAAMLSQLGCITLPTETVEKLHEGKALSEAEQQMVARVPAVTEQLLGNIPRLEVVRTILATYLHPSLNSQAVYEDPQRRLAERGAQLLRVALDFDVLEAQGNSAEIAIATLRSRVDCYDPRVVEALAAIRGGGGNSDVREVQVSGLRAGMILAEDVKLASGSLWVARGYEITVSFVERARNFRPGTVREPIRVLVGRGKVAS